MKKAHIILLVFSPFLLLVIAIISLKVYQRFVLHSMANSFEKKRESVELIWNYYLTNGSDSRNPCYNDKDMSNDFFDHCKKIGSKKFSLWHGGDLYISMYWYSPCKRADYICIRSKLRKEDIKTNNYEMIPIKGSDNCYIFLNDW